MGYYMGMRQGETLNLTWDRVDLENGFIRLKEEDTKENRPKTVLIHPIVYAELKNLTRGINSPVCLWKGKALPEWKLRKAFTAAVKRAQIQNFSFHDLRHTAITNMANAGTPEKLIMAQVGHTNKKTHDRYYTALDEEIKKIRWSPNEEALSMEQRLINAGFDVEEVWKELSKTRKAV